MADCAHWQQNPAVQRATPKPTRGNGSHDATATATRPDPNAALYPAANVSLLVKAIRACISGASLSRRCGSPARAGEARRMT